jgi:hypothetical protein
MSEVGDVVGVYGAILATYLGVRGWLRNRQQLSLALDEFDIANEQDDPGSTFRLRVVNLHERPIKIEEVGVSLAIDFRRLPQELFGLPQGGYTVEGEPFQLATFESADFYFASRLVTDQLAGSAPHLDRSAVDEFGNVVESWTGDPPQHVHDVWATDVTGRVHRQRPPGWLRREGRENWNAEAQPIVRGRIAAAWLRLSHRVLMMPTIPEPVRVVANALHRVRLFPVELPRA